MAGFGVSSGDLTKTAGQYESHGSELGAMKAQILPVVGAPHVGRKFKGYEGKFKTHFDRLGANVEAFGKEATAIATRLKDVAKTYESTESSTSGKFKG